MFPSGRARRAPSWIQAPIPQHRFSTRSCGWYGSHLPRTFSRRNPLAFSAVPGAADPSADPSRRVVGGAEAGATENSGAASPSGSCPVRAAAQFVADLQAITRATNVDRGRMVEWCAIGQNPHYTDRIAKAPKVVSRSPRLLFEVRMMLTCSKTCPRLFGCDLVEISYLRM